MELKDLKQDKRNYRKHDDKNISLIRKSVDEAGLGRSIVIDSENEIIAGNGLVSSISQNTPIKVVETDGTELVVVKRTDLKTNDEKRKKLAIMDNSTSDASSFDIELLKMDFDDSSLADMGIEIPEVENISNISENEMQNELNDLRGLIYERQGEKPKINDLLQEDEKIKSFKEKIKTSNCTKEEKDFMLKALTRFYRFNFKNIAEYYCHSNDELKNLFAELLLVIPDGKKLLRNKLLNLDNIISEDFGEDE